MINPLIVIADAHVSEKNGNMDSFFLMLNAISRVDGDVIFLGDIFDLWIGLTRYQHDGHREFLAWCKNEKQRRMVGFIEGNHEFFITKNYSNSFTWCEQRRYVYQGFLFVHGDLINGEDKNYLRFRQLTKNRLSECCVRWMPWGPDLVDSLKRKMKTTNLAYRAMFPEKLIEAYADCHCVSTGEGQSEHKGVVFGHFHHEKNWMSSSERALISMPAWLDNGHVGVLNFGDKGVVVDILPWQSL